MIGVDLIPCLLSKMLILESFPPVTVLFTINSPPNNILQIFIHVNRLDQVVLMVGCRVLVDERAGGYVGAALIPPLLDLPVDVAQEHVLAEDDTANVDIADIQRDIDHP